MHIYPDLDLWSKIVSMATRVHINSMGIKKLCSTYLCCADGDSDALM